MSINADTERPLVVHVVNSLRAGGLENGLVNLINRMPEDQFRHAIVCLTDYDDFAERINRKDVKIVSLHKRPGKDPAWYWRMWRTLRSLKPSIVHTRNLATIEAQGVAFLAGVAGRVHGEHGWDVYDLRGANKKYRLLRRLVNPFIRVFIPLSQELQAYLLDGVGVSPRKIVRICNGVDVRLFHPRQEQRPVPIPGAASDDVIIGCVGRMEPVKDPLNLVEAFVLAAEQSPEFRRRARLVMIGGGSLHDAVRKRLDESGLSERTWIPGHRDDIAELLRSFDLFVLPSKAEGISNTILEAMASGLPVLATDVGGNRELLRPAENGALVASEDPAALADGLIAYVTSPELRREHGIHSRELAETHFSIAKMVNDYRGVYEGLLS